MTACATFVISIMDLLQFLSLNNIPYFPSFSFSILLRFVFVYFDVSDPLVNTYILNCKCICWLFETSLWKFTKLRAFHSDYSCYLLFDCHYMPWWPDPSLLFIQSFYFRGTYCYYMFVMCIWYYFVLFRLSFSLFVVTISSSAFSLKMQTWNCEERVV